MRRVILTALVGLSLATPAGAVVTATWKKFGSNTTTTTLSPGSTAVFDFVAADGTSAWGPTIQATDCQNVTFMFDADMGGTGGTATVYIYNCLTLPTAKVGNANQCHKILVDIDADGLPNDTPLNGNPTALRVGITGISGNTIFAPYIVDAATSTETPRLMMTCVTPR